MEHPFLFESAWVVFKPTMETDGGVTELREEQYRKDAGTVLFQESTVSRNTTQEDRQVYKSQSSYYFNEIVYFCIFLLRVAM